MEILKEKKAITLVVLVITIIILLILAGVTIGIATSGSGIFEKAKEARDKYQNAKNEEEMQLAKYSNEIDSYVSGNRDYTPISYSTEEQDTGMKWIDGKTVYQKTITGLNITLGWNDKYFAYKGGISPLVDSVETIINGTGYGTNFSMPITVSIGTTWDIRGVDVWTINAITLQYTKTTD